MAKNAPTKNAVEMQRIRARERTWRVALEGIFGLGRTAVRAGAWAVSIFFIAEGAGVFAGKETSVNAMIEAIVSVNADRWVAYSVAAVAVIVAIRSNRLRRKTIADLADYVKKLEMGTDPDRSSSGLTAEGKTADEDKDGA